MANRKTYLAHFQGFDESLILQALAEEYDKLPSNATNVVMIPLGLAGNHLGEVLRTLFIGYQLPEEGPEPFIPEEDTWDPDDPRLGGPSPPMGS